MSAHKTLTADQVNALLQLGHTYTPIDRSAGDFRAQAVQLLVDCTIPTYLKSGGEKFKPTDWLVRVPDRDARVGPDEFRRSYQRDTNRFHRWWIQTRETGIYATLAALYSRQRQAGLLRGRIVLYTLLFCGFITVGWWGYSEYGHYLLSRNCRPADVPLRPTDMAAGIYHCTDSVAQRLWATVYLFTGGYLSLSQQWDPQPPPRLAQISLFASLLTVGAAGSLVVWSRRAVDYFKVYWHSHVGVLSNLQLVVIGNGESAAAIIASCADLRIKTLLVTDTRESKAAEACVPQIPIIESTRIELATSIASVKRIIRHVAHTVVATDDDGLNMRVQDDIRRLRLRKLGCAHLEDLGIPRFVTDPKVSLNRHRPPRDMVLVHDPDYASLVQPTIIRMALPHREVTCPAFNVAEQIIHVLIKLATAHDRDLAVTFVAHSEGQTITEKWPAQPIREWVENLGAALTILRERIPAVPVVTTVPSPGRHTVIIHTGSAAKVAVEVLEPTIATTHIAVANFDLVDHAADIRAAVGDRVKVQTGGGWLKSDDREDAPPAVLVIDPVVVAFDASLVTDDVGTQWARMFDLTYNLLFYRGGDAVNGWLPGAPMADQSRSLARRAKRAARQAERLRPMQEAIIAPPVQPEATFAHPPRNNKPAEAGDLAAFAVMKSVGNRYSSEAAVHHMLYLLGLHRYELRRVKAPITDPTQFRDEDIESMAEAEHEHWLRRRWTPRFCWCPLPAVRTANFSGIGANFYCWKGLEELEKHEQGSADVSAGLRGAARYNRDSVRFAYPAIAAAWGYRIEPMIEPPPTTGNHTEHAGQRLASTSDHDEDLNLEGCGNLGHSHFRSR